MISIPSPLFIEREQPRMFGYTGTEIAGIITALSGASAIVGAGIKVVLGEKEKRIAREDRLRAEESARQNKAREELQEEIERRFDMQAGQIGELKQTVTDQAATLRRYEDMLDDYVVHIRKLESGMRDAGIPIPPFEVQERKKVHLI